MTLCVHLPTTPPAQPQPPGGMSRDDADRLFREAFNNMGATFGARARGPPGAGGGFGPFSPRDFEMFEQLMKEALRGAGRAGAGAGGMGGMGGREVRLTPCVCSRFLAGWEARSRIAHMLLGSMCCRAAAAGLRVSANLVRDT